jgi:D-alanyl-D-alanine dipeptidase
MISRYVPKQYFLIALSINFVSNSVAYAEQKASSYNLVNIKKLNPTIILDIKYATADNFTHKVVYPSAHCYLCADAAQALNAVQKELQTMGLGLKIWDGYRPLAVQKIFWNLVPDERYVANPAKGSRHNRGCAVDCTLIDKHGKELLMPTAFDDFTDKAHADCMDVPLQAIKNRELLQKVMCKHGFKIMPFEWWHFDFAGWEQYPILDVSFDELDKH